MRVRLRWIAFGLTALAMGVHEGWGAAPALTTIQDVIYMADGSRFNGVAFIEWKAFQTSDLASVAANSTMVAINQGQLRIRLAPTTTATGGAYYTIRYHSQGRLQFMEIWSVPPSGATLKLKDVRTLNGMLGGAPTVLRLSDVTGLEDELGSRPVKGLGFSPSRVVVSDSTGALESVLGSATDCVRVDGSTGPCGSGADPGVTFVEGEAVSGAVDGSNTIFTLSESPSPASSLQLFWNGVLMSESVDYILSGSTVSFINGVKPASGDLLRAYYRISGGVSAVSVGGTAFVDREVPSGTINGTNSIFTLVSTPSPGTSLQLYRNGILMQANGDFTLSGNTITFLAGAVPQSGDGVIAFYRVAP